MRILAVDDERNALNGMVKIIQETVPGSRVDGFLLAREAMAFAKEHAADIAFLDISMPVIDGITMAEELKKLYPHINIIFTTGYSDYAQDAFALHASGYIMKPVTREKVEEELSHLRYTNETEAKRLRIRTFGPFEVFYGDEPLSFRYRKTKELLAVLVDRRGALVTNRDIVRMLWPDDAEDERAHLSYVNNLRADLLATLAEKGLEDCVVSRYGSVGIRTDGVDCDYYNFLRDGTRPAGFADSDYMSRYQWAEATRREISACENGGYRI